jgi:hypothetical protein
VYREDVMAFINFLGINWPERSFELFTASIKDVGVFREVERDAGDWILRCPLCGAKNILATCPDQ